MSATRFPRLEHKIFVMGKTETASAVVARRCRRQKLCSAFSGSRPVPIAHSSAVAPTRHMFDTFQSDLGETLSSFQVFKFSTATSYHSRDTSVHDLYCNMRRQIPTNKGKKQMADNQSSDVELDGNEGKIVSSSSASTFELKRPRSSSRAETSKLQQITSSSNASTSGSKRLRSSSGAETSKLPQITSSSGPKPSKLLQLKSSSNTSDLPRLRVLSLFDGIGTGYYALLKLGFDIEVFYASEIDKDALMVTKHNFSDNIKQLGSVTEINWKILDEISPINLIFGGSPCSDLSGVNHRKRGLHDPEGTGILFHEYYRIWNYLNVKASRANTPFYWLFENVASMENKNKDTISKYFEWQPIVLDSLHLSPQRRKRYFWSSFPGIAMLADIQRDMYVSDAPKLEDYLEKNLDRQAYVEVVGTITSKRSCLQDSKSRNPVCQDGQYTGLYITEIEAIFGLPPHFTDVGDLSISSRQKLLGRAWSVQVIIDVLRLLSNKFAKK